MDNEPDAEEGRVVSSSTGRDFSIQASFFQNGSFLTIFEGEPRIGAVRAVIHPDDRTALRARDQVAADDGVKSLRIVMAADESVRTGNVVSLA